LGVEVSQPAGEGTPIEAVRARAFTVPTDRPEADDTLRWDSTTVVLAQVSAGGISGAGYRLSRPT
jgi:hypothetical protein